MKDAITGLMFFYIVCFQIFFFSLKKKEIQIFQLFSTLTWQKLIFVAVFFHNQVKLTKKNSGTKLQIGISYFPKFKKKTHLTDRRMFSIFSGSAPDDNIHIQGFGNSTLNNYWYFRQKSTHLTHTQFQNLNWKLLASVG